MKARSIFFAIVLLALSLPVIIRPDDADHFLAYGGYYVVALSFVTALIAVVLALGEPAKWRSYLWGALASLLLTISIFVAVKPGYRVLSDETNLVAVARSMSVDKNVFNTTMQLPHANGFEDLENLLPTRPLLYPFLISVVHNISGYRYQNAFVVNAILCFLVLLMVWCAGHTWQGAPLACFLVFLCASQPVFSLTATSAGFEMTNLWGIFLIGFWIAIEDRVNEDRWDVALIYLFVLLCHIRYENFIYALPLAFYAPRLLKRVDHLLFGLILLTPRLWQAYVAIGNMENGEEALLDPLRIGRRSWNFIKGLTDPMLTYPYALMTTVLIAAAVLFWAWKRQNPLTRPAKRTLLFVGASTVLYFLITSSHFLADPIHPSVSRLYMLPAITIIALAIPGFMLLPRRLQLMAAGAAACSWIFTQSIAIEKKQTRSLTLIRATEKIYRFIEENYDRSDVIITDRPGQYTVFPMGAVSHDWAQVNLERLKFGQRRGVYPHVYLAFYYDPNQGRKHPLIDSAKHHSLLIDVPFDERQNLALVSLVW